jgi:hypothetical protein
MLPSVGGIITAEKDPIISRQGTAGKRQHIMLTIQQKFEIIRSVEALSDNLEHPINQHMCDPTVARLMELHCTNRDIFVQRCIHLCCGKISVYMHEHTHTQNGRSDCNK